MDLESVAIIGMSFDDAVPKEKNIKYKVKLITKGKSWEIIYLIHDSNRLPKNIIF